MNDPIVESVRQKLLERSQTGLLKYNIGLYRTDLGYVDWLRKKTVRRIDLKSPSIVATVGIG